MSLNLGDTDINIACCAYAYCSHPEVTIQSLSLKFCDRMPRESSKEEEAF